MNKYDVIIVGAGLAGLSLARELAPYSPNILIIDKKNRGNDVAYHSSGTFMKPADFRLPENIFHPIKEMIFSSRNETVSKPIRDAYVIDRKGLYSFLEAEAIKNTNCEIKYSSKLLRAETINDFVKWIEYENDNKVFRVTSKIYVDCTGICVSLAKFAGIATLKPVMAAGLECLVKLTEYPERAYLFVGSNIAGGYGWVFPKSMDTAIAGVGTVDSEKYKKLNTFFQEMRKQWGPSGVIYNSLIEKNYATLRTGKPLKKLARGNLVLLGDSALQANPLAGEGIRFVMDAARMAAQSIKNAYIKDKCEYLKVYERQWKLKYYIKFKYAYFMQRILNKATTNDRTLDKGIRVLKTCSDEEFRKLLSADINLGFLAGIFVRALSKKILK